MKKLIVRFPPLLYWKQEQTFRNALELIADSMGLKLELSRNSLAVSSSEPEPDLNLDDVIKILSFVEAAGATIAAFSYGDFEEKPTEIA